jgi:FKBP-type peptidyl-prolyl cis-trans isomerase
MSEVKTGDTVRIHYKGTLLDGSVLTAAKGLTQWNLRLGPE